MDATIVAWIAPVVALFSPQDLPRCENKAQAKTDPMSRACSTSEPAKFPPMCSLSVSLLRPRLDDAAIWASAG